MVQKHDGTIYTKYFLDDTDGTCCKDCGKFKPNTYVRCIDCYAINQEYWNNKPRKFPKGKCLIKL